MGISTTITGWGNYPKQESQLIKPTTTGLISSTVDQEGSLIARGMGRSYGDSANAHKVLATTYCNHFIEFDDKTGKFTAEAGITLREILHVIVPRGWFLPVTPGTSYVTLGGAIASDVHGKNHHNAGTIGQYVISLSLVIGSGEVVTSSKLEYSDLFHATCGGMGLTGVITNATIQLLPIQSSFINQQTVKANCIEAACEMFEDYSDSTYSVAWIDCLAKGKNLGRSVILLGEHAEADGLEIDLKEPISVPFSAPSALLNSLIMKAFNGAYWLKAKHKCLQTLPLMPYFYPLDAIGNWNKLYGKAGFLQFQCVIPKNDGISNLRVLLNKIANSGEGSFLAVLKKFGAENNNLLSFPTEGYTLAMDFKLNARTIETLQKLEDIVVGMGGRLYLTKDAIMKEVSFKATYPKWEEFESVRERYGAIGKFSSVQSRRLGLA